MPKAGTYKLNYYTLVEFFTASIAVFQKMCLSDLMLAVPTLKCCITNDSLLIQEGVGNLLSQLICSSGQMMPPFAFMFGELCRLVSTMTLACHCHSVLTDSPCSPSGSKPDVWPSWPAAQQALESCVQVDQDGKQVAELQ